MKPYLKLLRVKHYVKNLLLFMPLFFSGKVFEVNAFKECFLGFLAFSAAASIVYIINDILDAESDRQHNGKKFRPIASGEISEKKAIILAAAMIFLLAILIVLLGNKKMAWILLLAYVALNIAYSIWLKKIAIIDVSIIAIGFILRISFGGAIIGVPVSSWMYLTVMAMSFYLALGKRRNELKISGVVVRKVLNQYTEEFLDKMMYMSLGLTIVFYSLWCVSPNEFTETEKLIWTVPLVFLISMKYSMNIECEKTGDPAEIFFRDKVLILLTLSYVLLLGFLLYFV